MECIYCKKSIPDGSRVCMYCGRTLSDELYVASDEPVVVPPVIDRQPAPAVAPQTADVSASQSSEKIDSSVYFSKDKKVRFFGIVSILLSILTLLAVLVCAGTLVMSALNVEVNNEILVWIFGAFPNCLIYIKPYRYLAYIPAGLNLLCSILHISINKRKSNVKTLVFAIITSILYVAMIFAGFDYIAKLILK